MRSELGREANNEAVYMNSLRSVILALLVGCAGPEPQLKPGTAPQRIPDTASAPGQQRIQDTAPLPQVDLPSGYTLTDTTDWATDTDYGKRAVLRRGGVAIDTVDLNFGVAAVGDDSLVFLPVRTDTVPLSTASVLAFDSFPTEHVLWTPTSRRKLRDVLPFFNAFFSSPSIARESVILYWGLGPGDKTNRLYAMQCDFRTARLDSLFLNREDRLATDYRYHLGPPQIHGNEVSFDGVVLDGTTWLKIRDNPPAK